MRSRYSAFAKGEIAYIINTQINDRDIDHVRANLEKSAHHVNWLDLIILSTRGGTSEDTRGEVEFLARFYDRDHDQTDMLHEVSQFCKIAQEWIYVDGIHAPAKNRIPKRNDLCWCGSNIKFKKCHGHPEKQVSDL